MQKSQINIVLKIKISKILYFVLFFEKKDDPLSLYVELGIDFHT